MMQHLPLLSTKQQMDQEKFTPNLAGGTSARGKGEMDL
jgi:hypothetical protein